jgi:methylthioribose-1-phosphate isomerase
MLSPVSWSDGGVRIIKQTLLPDQEVWLDLKSVEDVARAIRCLDIRGAPAIGVAAAMGMAQAARLYTGSDPVELSRKVKEAGDILAGTRPTAVNLFWAIERMKKKLGGLSGQNAAAIRAELIEEAQKIREEDIAFCKAIGQHGAGFMPDRGGVLTHCNAGALATGGYGTALGVIRAAVEAGKDIQVYADETRPLLQGARLTTWELMQDGIPVTLICDSAAGHLMRLGRVQACVVGADRIAANGDTANKIGTYSVASLAYLHGIPFYVAAPTSTVDLALSIGEQIPIEERDACEITSPRDTCFAPPGVPVFNPAFDVTPNNLIRAIITENGAATHPDMTEKLKRLVISTSPA